MGVDAVNKGQIGPDIWAAAKRQQTAGDKLRVVVGIPDDTAKNAMAAGDKFIYIDHAYFNRGWHTGNFRAIRDNVHLTHIVKRPDDRFQKYGVKIEPWRKDGSEVVIAAPSMMQAKLYGIGDQWAEKMQTKLRAITGREVTIKRKNSVKLRDFCINTWAVVTYASVAGVEAALMGIPVFSTQNCPSWPINAGPIEKIDEPEYSDARFEWACSLAYATWSTRELHKVKWRDYSYGTL